MANGEIKKTREVHFQQWPDGKYKIKKLVNVLRVKTMEFNIGDLLERKEVEIINETKVKVIIEASK